MPDRFEREIDEILRKIDDFPRGPAPKRRNSNSLGHKIGGFTRALPLRLAHITGGQVMLAALGLMVFSYFLQDVLEQFWVYGLTLGLILFFTAFVMSLQKGRGRGGETYFRGRPRSAYESAPVPLAQRLRDWWRRSRRR